MGFDPKEPRDKSGKWSSGASGHNAGEGNRAIAKKIKSHFVEFPLAMKAKLDAHSAKVRASPNFRVVDEHSKLTADEIAQVRHAARSFETNPNQTIKFKSPAAYIKLHRKYVSGN